MSGPWQDFQPQAAGASPDGPWADFQGASGQQSAPAPSTGVTWGDTGEAVPAPQAQAYMAMLNGGGIDASKPLGDPRRPFLYRQGMQFPEGSAYIDVDGKLRVVPQVKLQTGAMVPIDQAQGFRSAEDKGWMGADPTGVAPQRYAQPAPYDGHPEHYAWDWRLPDPGKGKAWPLGTLADPRANDTGNSVSRSASDPAPYFGHPIFDPTTIPAMPAPPQADGAKTDWRTDMAKTAPAGLARGATALVGAPGDLSNMAERGLGWLYNRGMEVLGPDLGGWSHYHAQLLDHAGPDIQEPGYFPTSQLLNKGVEHYAGPLYEPKTAPGKYLNAAEELLPSTVAGGEGVAGRIVPALVGGAGGQAAADATKGTVAEPYGRLAGTLAGVVLGHSATAPVTAEKMLAGGARGATQQQIDLAHALMTKAENAGVRLSGPEALNQVTSGSFPGLSRVQRVAEGTREGQAVFGPLMADRPQQLADALHSTVLDALSPPTAMPSAIGLDAQAGAQSVLDTARGAVNARAKPFYDNLGGDVTQAPAAGYTHGSQYTGQPGQFIPDEQFGPLASSPAYQEALRQVRGDPLLNAGIGHLPDNDLSVVDRTVKQLDTNAQGYAQTATNPGGNNFKAAQAQAARAQADDLAASVSPDWRAARDIVKGGHEVLIDPLNAGPVGQIAKTSDVGAQVSALYPRSPLEGAASETAQAIRAMRRVNDGEFDHIPADLTRQHLAGSWNEASRGAVPDQWVGARWYKNTMGNPEQKANLLSGVSAAGQPEIGDALSGFGDIAQATGYRARQGSATAFNERDLHDLQGGGPLGKVAGVAMDPLEIGKVLKDGFDRWKLGRNSEALANMTVGGTAADRAKALADALKNQPNSLPGWATKMLLYDNPVIPGRKDKPDAP